MRPRRETTESATPIFSRKPKTVRDKITGGRGIVIRVYPEGWLLTEMADGTWSLFTPDEVELVQEEER